MTVPFGTRLAQAVADRGPLCVGIDPHASLLQAWGLNDDVLGLEWFSRTVVEQLAGQVAALKPQAAFYERFGSAGVRVLETTIAETRAAGAVVITDAKRGDIGSTMAAYAEAFLAPGAPLESDALTVSPYLGFGSLQPAVDLSLAHGRGLFVLALTSNPEGPQVQHALGEDGRMTAQAIVDAAAAVNATIEGPGSVGVVVGATIGRTGIDLTSLDGPILAPGFGAQGATAEDLQTVFGSALPSVLPTTSREVLGAGANGLAEAAQRSLDQIRAVLG